jgi:hypothetical protein
MQMPDSARMLMGLAPADALVSSVRDERELAAEFASSPLSSGRQRVDSSDLSSTRVAICGSRSKGANEAVIDAAVRSLARLVMVQRLRVNHGPIGVGIEVMTHIADHYQPPGLRGAVAIFGRRNVILDAEYVIFIGGGTGTQAEADLAVSMGKRIIPFGATGGSAHMILQQLLRDPRLNGWMPDNMLGTIRDCGHIESGAASSDIERMTDDFVYAIDNLIKTDQGDSSD